MRTAFCFDLDGTITQQEILPLIARDLGIEEELEVLTNATISGILPFSGSFKLRCRLLADVPISRVKAIASTIALFEEIVSFINQNGQSCFIITGNLDVWIEDIIKKFRCTTYSSKAIVSNDKLTGISQILDKGEAAKDIRTKGFDRIVAVGDGMGDIDMFKQADISIAFGASHKPSQALYETCNHVIFDESDLCKILNRLIR